MTTVFVAIVLAALIAGVILCLGTGRAPDGDEKFLAVMALPDGIAVRHSPEKVHAVEGGASGCRYTWPYFTEVSATAGELVIVEFGAFCLWEDRWILSTLSGRPYTAEHFAAWYECPGARLAEGEVFRDPNNWSGGEDLRGNAALWYFIGEDAAGKRYKGTAAMRQLPELRPRASRG